MIRKLLEAKTLDYEYEKDWSDIKREDFDAIIVLDPQTDVSKNRLGSNAKQLLLPKFLEGETDFLSKADEVRNALNTYTQNRGKYPAVLRNIANFPSVKDFVEYVTLGDESEFAKTHDFTDIEKEKEPKINKLDKIYNQFYSSIERPIFDKIIALDPATTEGSIGEVARNLLLPKYASEKEFLDDSDRIEDAISLFYNERNTYPAERRELGKYGSVKEFLDFILSGGESNFMHYMNNLVETGKLPADSFKLLASTRTYDVIQPLSWEANAYIVQKPYPKASSTTAKLKWCTGYGESSTYWNNYSSSGPLVCFIYKKDSTDRPNNFQLNLSRKTHEVLYFLEGNDSYPWGKSSEGAFDQFLIMNPDVLLSIKSIQMFAECPTVQKVLQKYKLQTEPVEFNSPADIEKIKKENLSELVKEIHIHSKEVPATIFSDFKSLKKVTFDEGLTKIGAQAFFNCAKLNNLVLPSTLQEIGSEAFAACTSLSNSIRIPDSLVKIGRRAFADTHCKLSINKDRKEKLSIDAHDHDWFVSHAKSITIQNNEALEEELNEDILDENIPRDLVKAYQNSISAERGIQSHPDSEHKNIGIQARRKSVKYAYDKATYEVLTPEQAIEYLQLSVLIDPRRDESGKIIAKVRTLDRDVFNTRICNLRFIIDNKVIEYEVRGGNVLYLAYWMEIPYSYFDEYPLFKGKNGQPTNDVRFANKYSDIYTVIQIADKIYKTDEYEHRNDDAAIRARRAQTDKTRMLRKNIPNSSLSYRPHDLTWNFGMGENSAQYDSSVIPYRVTALDVPDTGAHDVSKRFAALSSGNEYRNYIEALKAKKEAFKNYSYYTAALVKLQNEQSLYDEDEYQEELEKLTAKRDQAKEFYKQRTDAVRKEKDKLTFVISQSLEDSNKFIYKTLGELKELKDKEYKVYQQLTKLKGQNIREFSSVIKSLENTLQSYRNQVDTRIKEQQEILAKIAQLQASLARKEEDIATYREKALEIEQNMGNVVEGEMDKKFAEMEKLQNKMDTLQQAIDASIRKRANKKDDTTSDEQPKATTRRNFDPSLDQIIKERTPATYIVYDENDAELISFPTEKEAIDWAEIHDGAASVYRVADGEEKQVVWHI